MATLGEWLNVRRDEVPETLWKELDTQAVACARRDAEALAGLRAVTESQMAHMRTRSCEERRDALDLLSTDAMVTYLLELAASQGIDELGNFAGDVLHMVAGHRATTDDESAA
jgi:hypothetical protein